MSFFDESDEPPPPRRAAPRQRRPPARGGRPHRDPQIQTRRTVAVVVIVVVIVLLAVGIHACDVSQTNSALRDYTNSVWTIIRDSDGTGSQLFRSLAQSGGAGNGQNLQSKLTGLLSGPATPNAESVLDRARNLSVPSQMEPAQRNLVLALTMRRDGIRTIAGQIQAALGTTTNRTAIDQIAAATARFYASDVVYKGYAAPAIAAALNGAGIPVGGTNGESINAGQFLPDLGWLQPGYIAAKLGTRLQGSPPQAPPTLTGAAVGTNTMVPGVTNHVQASPPPTFTISVANSGKATVYDVNCSVSISGQSDTGTSTITQLAAGQTTTCNVTLPSSPTKGTFNVTASVSAGAGGKTNTLEFPVDFL